MVVDVTGWQPAGEEQLGTKPKQWLRSPDDELWLWKQSEMQRDRRHGEFRKGDDWSEVVAGRLARHLRIPVAAVELAVRGRHLGVISRSVLADVEQLAHGNELLAEIGVGSGDPHDRTGYTLDAVAQVLATIDPPSPSAELPHAFDWFAGYLVLDAMVGNTDRHQDNWATIRGAGRRRLSPSFDHASCLGFQLSDAERDERLTTADTNRTVAAYARAARTKFEGVSSPVDAAVFAVGRCPPPVRRHWASVVEGAPDLAQVLAEVPADRMSAAARRFARALYPREPRLTVVSPPYDGSMTDAAEQERTLFVSWRDPEVGSIHPIGRLVRRIGPDGERYSFAYLKLVEKLPGFEPLPGLPDLHRCYDSNRLFPVFSNRLMPRSRPDYDLLASRVDLTGDADPFEVLARTGGRRATDRIEMFAGPHRMPDGQSCVLFFARGIRHVQGAAETVASLRPGDELRLVDDPSNQFNARAIVLRVSDGRLVGWVPDYLVDHVHELRALNGEEPTVEVEHVNDETVAPHMRLLCRLHASWPDGYVAFSGPDFEPLVDLG